MADTTSGSSADAGQDSAVPSVAYPKPKGRPGRKPRGLAPVVIRETPDQPDPDHVLTWRQRKVLRVIRESVRQRGYPPSMREIADAVGLASTASVAYQLDTLQRKGYLRRAASRARAVELRLPGHTEWHRDEEEAAKLPGIDIPSQTAGR